MVNVMDAERLNAQNRQVCFLTQAMCGAVTPNWRSVSMTFQKDAVHLEFFLEQDSVEDREEIQSVADQFSIFQEDARHYSLGGIGITVTTEELKTHGDQDRRLVYRRKEVRKAQPTVQAGAAALRALT